MAYLRRQFSFGILVAKGRSAGTAQLVCKEEPLHLPSREEYNAARRMFYGLFRACQNKIFGAQLRASACGAGEGRSAAPSGPSGPHGSKFSTLPHLGSSGAGGSFQAERLYPVSFDAPLALVVLADHATSWKRKYDGKDAADVDAAIVGTHIMLQAVALGLGSTWVGYFDPSALREAYHVPENLEPVAVFPVGYPAKGCKPVPSTPSANHWGRL